MRRSQIVSLLLAILIGFGSLAGVLAAGWAPVLGVQLQGGVEVLLRPTAPADDEQLDRAIEIIRSRVDALGVAEPDITRQGEQVVVQLPGVKDKQRAVDLVGQTAELRFRPVLLTFNPFDEVDFGGAQQLAAAYNSSLHPESVDESASEAAGDELVDEQEMTAQELLELIDPEAAAELEAEAGDAAAVGDTSETVETADDAEAEEIDPSDIGLELFPEFTAPEDDLADWAVLLPGRGEPVGYVLGPAELTGEAVAEAAATFNNEWVVNVDLTDEGAVGFDEIAARYFGQQVAIVLDGVVESAPVIRATEFGGTAVISGTFDEDGARDLAVALRFGALPVEFEQDDVRTVSATLGEGTLRAGVIAGIVGLILVGLYMLAYYRLLGIVAVASLAISGSVLWSLISWLGESRGLALTLAGTTGIIVSIGVQVDSNIVYYERIKEEVRRGRAVRSAADASFKGAFMTIVWADLASLIGAGVLYQLTSGTVRGFALYLGLATLIDLAVSYFFMRPLVVFIARRLVNEEPRRLGVLRTADGDVAPATDPTGGTS
ncbi:MAG: protein translocase subunit SecD [Acidimicrobiaceae bacterium]|nr:protein translocase subunit SecD [Acidimicrobiaceae bacterium]MDE0677400.1 protein translocase subunit SecD [Acidimicrobiaceae bacterium]MYA81287.1 protein translocase subunit SecD [Acidimicrobiales bacterium]MYH75012.1 protein translocase subunit SecD [Acidimicrobiales bacterium]MYK70122.1 protein translocase subunit SecD [Acidimicrobiales bacterium]